MATATEQYVEKVQRLAKLTGIGRQKSSAADSLRAEIDLLWRSMTSAEQEQALQATKELLSGET